MYGCAYVLICTCVLEMPQYRNFHAIHMSWRIVPRKFDLTVIQNRCTQVTERSALVLKVDVRVCISGYLKELRSGFGYR